MGKIGGAISSGFKAVREAVVKPVADEVKTDVGMALKSFELGSTNSTNPQNPQNQSQQSNSLPSNPHAAPQQTPEAASRLKEVNRWLEHFQADYNRNQQRIRIEEDRKKQIEQEEAEKKRVPQFESAPVASSKASPGQRPTAKNPEIGRKKS